MYKLLLSGLISFMLNALYCNDFITLYCQKFLNGDKKSPGIPGDFSFSIHAVAVFVVTVSVSDTLPSLAYAVITA